MSSSKLIFPLLLAFLLSGCQTEKASPRYNLLFILTDEQRYDTSLPYGNAQIRTPNLNQLGEESLVFEKAYVTQPVCSPARSSILTGYYPHTTTVTTNNIDLPANLPVFPALLPNDTYTSAYIGKWHLGKELDVRVGFNRRISTEDGYTQDDTTRFSNYHHWLLEKGYEPDDQKWGVFSRGFCNRLPYQHTKSRFMEEQALAFLEENRSQPFILYLGFLEPHTPNFGPFNDLHDPTTIELDSTYDAFIPPDEPLRHTLIRNHENFDRDREKLQAEMAKYWGLVHQVDLSVGAIVARLKELGLYENTIIVYTSEHGKMMGKFGISPKRVMYEASSRIPLFLRIPGQKGRKINYPVSQIDLVPTLLDAMGHPIPENMPGKSLLPHLEEQEAGNVFLEWHPNSNQAERYPNCPEDFSEAECHQSREQCIRTIVTPGGWKLNKSAREADRSQLFNLQEDPLEVHNLYYDSNYQSIRDSLLQLILDWQQEVRDTLRL